MSNRDFSSELKQMLINLSPYKNAQAYIDIAMSRIDVKDSDYPYYLKNATSRAVVKASAAPHTGVGHSIVLSVFGLQVVSFMLVSYPACCGAKIIHNFACSSELTTAQLTPVLDRLFAELRTLGFIHRNERIIIMMVERRSKIELDEGIPERMCTDLKPIATPTMMYQPLWEYFHTQLKVNTRLMYNNNSGNVLHDMEVILK